MVAALWYVRIGGKQHGPFTLEVVKQLAQQGKITPLTELKREAEIDWVVASSIPGLLVKKQPPPLPSVIPSTPDASDRTPIWIWALAGTAFLILAIVGAYAVFTIVDETNKQKIAFANQIETSNTAVRDFIREASQSLEKGDLDTAERLVRKALAIDGATEKNEAEQMIDTIANAKINKKAEQLYAKTENAVFGFGNFTSIQDTANRKAATTQVTQLSTAIKTYQLLMGGLPPNLEALVNPPADLAKPGDWTKQLERVPNDPWNRPYEYKVNGSTFELRCVGPDGKSGTSDDMVP
jgi:type II secretion system protein G